MLSKILGGGGGTHSTNGGRIIRHRVTGGQDAGTMGGGKAGIRIQYGDDGGAGSGLDGGIGFHAATFPKGKGDCKPKIWYSCACNYVQHN